MNSSGRRGTACFERLPSRDVIRSGLHPLEGGFMSYFRCVLVGLALLCLVSQNVAAKGLFVDAVNGSDTTGNGRYDNPFKTITHALRVDVLYIEEMFIAPGVYDEALGEVFPLRGRGFHGSRDGETIIRAPGKRAISNYYTYKPQLLLEPARVACRPAFP